MSYLKFVLTVIAIALVAIATRPYMHPAPVQAQSAPVSTLFFEPGVANLRTPENGQVLGAVAIDMRTGSVWGFPTGTSDPYPASSVDNKPFTSHPIPLGRFALNEAVGR